MTEIGVISQKDSVIESIVEWSIEDFLSLDAEFDYCYLSPDFSFANESWFLEIYPNGSRRNSTEGDIVLFLFRDSSGPRIKMEFTFGVKTVDGIIDYERLFIEDFNGNICSNFFCLNRSKLLKRKSYLLPSNTLTLVCRMKRKGINEVASSNNLVSTKCRYCNKTLSAQEDIQCHLRQCEELPVKCQKCGEDVALKNWYGHKCQMADSEDLRSSNYTHENKVLQDYKQLFLNRKECDAIIRVKEQEFSAHKTILAARSPVFESTFRSDMKEKETGIVDVEDCDPSSFSDFLCFLYCGEIETLSEENVFSLFATADKYDVQDLKDICVKFMKENISVNTFCDTMTLALLYCESELVTLATDFFTKNARKIAKTVAWQRFLIDNPTQSNELFIKVLDAAAGSNE